MTTEQHVITQKIPPAKNGWRTFGIVVITMAITLAVGYWVVTRYLFPTAFTPVTLNQQEQQVLDKKIDYLKGQGSHKSNQTTPGNRDHDMSPQPYSEVGASREINFTEKELNALLANNTDLAQQLVIDLSDNLASAKLLIHLDPDFPILGGKTVKVTAGMELGMIKGKPRAILKGISVWGVPLPNAWLDNMKNKDLFQEFGTAGGFWQTMRDGVETLDIKEGKLRIKLKE